MHHNLSVNLMSCWFVNEAILSGVNRTDIFTSYLRCFGVGLNFQVGNKITGCEITSIFYRFRAICSSKPQSKEPPGKVSSCWIERSVLTISKLDNGRWGFLKTLFPIYFTEVIWLKKHVETSSCSLRFNRKVATVTIHLWHKSVD